MESLSCSQCNGVACMRIKSFNVESNHEVAFTCLPYATRYHQTEPAGCRLSETGEEQVCICYDRNYCNRSPTIHKRLVDLSYSIVAVLLCLWLR
uniref:Protein sleepless n=1 Tax=Syphacia muris TaxID=451379 RepID=A0A0N5AP42_9BILA